MIRITIKAPFIGLQTLRVFRPSGLDTLKILEDIGIPIDMEPSTTHRVDYGIGFAEIGRYTKVEVKSDSKLAQAQMHELETHIRFLINHSFFTDEWGEITFEFSTCVFSF